MDEDTKIREKWLLKYLALQKNSKDNLKALENTITNLKNDLKLQEDEEISILKSLEGAIEQILSNLEQMKYDQDLNSNRLKNINSGRKIGITQPTACNTVNAKYDDQNDTDKENDDELTYRTKDLDYKKKMQLMTQESIKDILNKHIKHKQEILENNEKTRLNPRMTVIDNSFDNKLSDPNYLQIYKQMLKTYYLDEAKIAAGSTLSKNPMNATYKFMRESLFQLKCDIGNRIQILENRAQNISIINPFQLAHLSTEKKRKSCPAFKNRQGSTAKKLRENSPSLSRAAIFELQQNVTKLLDEEASLSLTDKELLAYAILHNNTLNHQRSDSNQNDVTLEDLLIINGKSQLNSKTTTPVKTPDSASKNPNSNTKSQNTDLNNARLDSIKEEEDRISMASNKNAINFIEEFNKKSTIQKNKHETSECEVGEAGDEGELRKNNTHKDISFKLTLESGNSKENDKNNKNESIASISPIKMQENSIQMSNKKTPKRSALFCLQNSPIEIKIGGAGEKLDLSFAEGMIKQIQECEQNSQYNLENIEVKNIINNKSKYLTKNNENKENVVMKINLVHKRQKKNIKKSKKNQ